MGAESGHGLCRAGLSLSICRMDSPSSHLFLCDTVSSIPVLGSGLGPVKRKTRRLFYYGVGSFFYYYFFPEAPTSCPFKGVGREGARAVWLSKFSGGDLGDGVQSCLFEYEDIGVQRCRLSCPRSHSMPRADIGPQAGTLVPSPDSSPLLVPAVPALPAEVCRDVLEGPVSLPQVWRSACASPQLVWPLFHGCQHYVTLKKKNAKLWMRKAERGEWSHAGETVTCRWANMKVSGVFLPL